MANLKAYVIKPNALQYIVWVNFQGLKFHESIKSANFTEFKYLEKTNYTVYACVYIYIDNHVQVTNYDIIGCIYVVRVVVK